MLDGKIQELKELVKGLWWVSEFDHPWTVEVWDDLDPLEPDIIEVVGS